MERNLDTPYPAKLEERLEVAIYFKSQIDRLTEKAYQRTEKILQPLKEEEGKRVLRELVSSALKSIAEGELAYFVSSLIRLGTRNLHLELRLNEITRLGEEVLGIISESASTDSPPKMAPAIVEEYLALFKSDEVRAKFFQEYMHLQENLLFRQVQELSLLAAISQLTQEDFLVDTSLPEQLLTRLMGILEADDSVAYFRSEYFRVIFTKFRGEEVFPKRPTRVTKILAEAVKTSFDPMVFGEFKRLVDEGYSWDFVRRDREIMELLDEFYPRFHSEGPPSGPQRILDFDLDNPLLQVCSVHSYMTYDLFVDEKNYGLIFVNRANPPEFTEDDYRFLSTFCGDLKQIVGNIVLTQKLKEMAITDSLTGVYNRRQFEVFLENELSRAKRYTYSVGLAMIDIDHFKEINDTMGHQAGDHILAELCRLLKEGLRVTEIIARYGGEEFAVIIPQADIEVVKVVGEKIRSLVESHTFTYAGKRVPLTVSVGLALFPQMAIDKKSLIEAADRALYRAKREGRNRVRFPLAFQGGTGRKYV